MPAASNETKRKQIRHDLLKQLAEKGNLTKYYSDLVDDYMNMWDVKEMLIQDIAERGVSVPWQKSTKQNDSVPNLLRINGQMIKTLQALGIKPSTELVSDGDDIDL